MKKYCVLLILLFFCYAKAGAQTVFTDTQWQKLIGYLKNEDWQNASALSKKYLLNIPATQIDEDAASVLRYMYIISEAGLMNLKAISKNEALQNVIEFTGHNVILPPHPFTLKTGFNSIELLNDKTDTLFITSSNRIADEIFSFEYIIPAKSYPMVQFKQNNSKMCRIGGRLKSINVEGITFPRFRIFIDNAQLVFED